MAQELSSIKYFTGIGPSVQPQRRVLSTWTKGIWAVCIACCIAGSYAVVHGGKEAQEVAAGVAYRTASSRQARTPTLYRYEREVKKFQDKYRSVLILHRLIEIGAGLGLLAGGALMMWRSPKARQVAFAACVAALLFHLSTALLQVFQFVSLKSFFESTSSAALRRAGLVGIDHQRVLLHGLGSLGFAFSLSVLLKLALPSIFYTWMALFLCQPHVREVFAEDPYPEFAELEAQANANDAAEFPEVLRHGPPLLGGGQTPQRQVDSNRFVRI